MTQPAGGDVRDDVRRAAQKIEDAVREGARIAANRARRLELEVRREALYRELGRAVFPVLAEGRSPGEDPEASRVLAQLAAVVEDIRRLDAEAGATPAR